MASNCPQCGALLTTVTLNGVVVSSCPACPFAEVIVVRWLCEFEGGHRRVTRLDVEVVSGETPVER